MMKKPPAVVLAALAKVRAWPLEEVQDDAFKELGSSWIIHSSRPEAPSMVIRIFGYRTDSSNDVTAILTECERYRRLEPMIPTFYGEGMVRNRIVHYVDITISRTTSQVTSREFIAYQPHATIWVKAALAWIRIPWYSPPDPQEEIPP